uniref:Uncharacterized protein n=1 Tax=Rhizophora mucronata TaxID=61149 RepID=A0A2P2QCK7_RHIMU
MEIFKESFYHSSGSSIGLIHLWVICLFLFMGS